MKACDIIAAGLVQSKPFAVGGDQYGDVASLARVARAVCSALCDEFGHDWSENVDWGNGPSKAKAGVNECERCGEKRELKLEDDE